jgi:hypothetical protein
MASSLLGPLVLLSDLFLFLDRETESSAYWSKMHKKADILVLDVEEFSDLFWGFTLDHVGYSLASDVTVLSAYCRAYKHPEAYRRGLMSR